MVAALRPAGSKSYLRKRVIFVPTLASLTAPSLVTLTAASALDITNMLFQSSAMPTQSTNLARAPKRVGDGESFEFIGETQATFGELRYSYNPQGAPGSDGVKAYEKFPANTTGLIVVRRGIDRDVDLAVGQFVTIFPVEMGPQLEVDEGENEGAENAIVQMVAQTGPKSQKVAIAA